jgi:hypothetical protein
MNEDVGRMRAEQPMPEDIPPPTPHGYSFPVLLQLRVIDLQKEILRALPAIFGGKLGPPFPPEPRPMTAEMRFRDQRETKNVHSVLAQMGIR